jgi:hypothetical protein
LPLDCCERAVRHEALLIRMEVGDLRRLAVVAAGEAGGSRPWGSPGVGGSSLDKVGPAEDCRMGRAR